MAFEYVEGCWCSTCEDCRMAKLIAENPKMNFLFMQRMVLCPDCGNKRCPRANSHEHSCTGSNDPGQPGSSYPAVNFSPGQ